MLSDKTGTLTKNIMRVRQLSLCGRVLGQFPGPSLAQLQTLSMQQPAAAAFLLCMAACNTCLLMPSEEDALEEGQAGQRINVTDFASMQRVLTGESPDEVY